MILTRETAFILNGSMMGLNEEMAIALREISKSLDQKELHIFVHMWNFWENKVYLDHFKKYFFESDNIVFHTELEDYNSKESWTAQQHFYKLLTGKSTQVIPHTVGKRVWYWYSLIKAMKAAKEYSDDLWVQTLYPNSRSNLRVPAGWINYLPSWYSSVMGVKKICGHPQFANGDINDMLFTDHNDSMMIKEQFLQADIKTFEKLLEGFNITNLIEIMAEMYTNYRVQAKVGVPIDAGELMEQLNNTKIYPNEASVFLKNFYDKNLDPKVNFLGHYSIWHKECRVENPWFTITKDSIVVQVPWIKIKPSQIKSAQGPTDIFWTESDDKRSDRLKDNTIGFVRNNKK